MSGKKVLILGSGGRLGAALQREWSKPGSGLAVSGFRHADLELSDLDAVRAKLMPIEFEVFVNCAALTNVDRCETHPEEAFRVNAEAAGLVAEICAAKHARCIHISTDYVFDGDLRRPYTEEDAVHPISKYGLSKRAGETAVLQASPEHLVARVSWVFGPDRPSFVDQVLQRAGEQDQAAAVSDKWAVPTYTLDAAKLLKPFLDPELPGGMLHLCNGGQCTWQEYGQYALDVARESGVEFKATLIGPLKMSDLKAFIAKRPVYTVMSTAKLTSITGETPRHWKDAVREYVRDHWAPQARGS